MIVLQITIALSEGGFFVFNAIWGWKIAGAAEALNPPP